MNAATVIALIISLVALAGLAFLLLERYKTRTLKSRFGPEYDRTVSEVGSPYRANALLEERQQRVAKYKLRQLTREERTRFVSEWKTVQQHFVDDPKDAIGQADLLVGQALRTRGYPTSDFEKQAADLSVEHAHVLSDYRIAHEIAVRSERGQATTEDCGLRCSTIEVCLKISPAWSRSRGGSSLMTNEILEIQPDETSATLPERSRMALFSGPDMESFRNSWGDVQGSFVDEPRQAVERADQLVESVIQRITENFAKERARLEESWNRGSDASTEDLRQALRRYRSFFDRLLTS